MMNSGSRTEVMSATTRNTESGWAEGHGAGMQNWEYIQEKNGNNDVLEQVG